MVASTTWRTHGRVRLHVASCGEVVHILLLPPFPGIPGWGLPQIGSGPGCILPFCAPRTRTPYSLPAPGSPPPSVLGLGPGRPCIHLAGRLATEGTPRALSFGRHAFFCRRGMAQFFPLPRHGAPLPLPPPHFLFPFLCFFCFRSFCTSCRSSHSGPGSCSWTLLSLDVPTCDRSCSRRPLILPAPVPGSLKLKDTSQLIAFLNLCPSGA